MPACSDTFTNAFVSESYGCPFPLGVFVLVTYLVMLIYLMGGIFFRVVPSLLSVVGIFFFPLLSSDFDPEQTQNKDSFFPFSSGSLVPSPF